MKHCALLTCDNLDQFIHDEHLLEEALRRRGWTWSWVSWKKVKETNWSSFDLAIVRTTWDYTKNLDLFLENMEWLEKQGCRLINSLSAIQWNCQKTYLAELAEKGVSVVPTEWVDSWRSEKLKNYPHLLEQNTLVIKPQVGAGSWLTFCLSPGELLKGAGQISDLQGMAVMVQPYQPQVVQEGEYSSHFFGGVLSHTILKKPKAGDFRSQEEYGSHIVPVEISGSDRSFCEKVLEAIPYDIFFARVDFVKGESGEPRLMELELIEPSLYFRFKEGSADLFIEELERYLDRL